MNDRPTQNQGKPVSGGFAFFSFAVRRRPVLAAAGLVALVLFAAHGMLFRAIGGLLTADRPFEDAERVWVRSHDFVVDGDGALSESVRICFRQAGCGVLVVDLAPMPCVRAGVLPPQAEAMRQSLHQHGLEFDRVEILPGGARDLATEVRILQQWLKQHRQSRVVLLCSKLKGAGMRCVLDRELEPSEAARVGIRGLPEQGIDETNWWKSRTGVKVFLVAAVDRLFWMLSDANRDTGPTWDCEAYEAELAASAKEIP